MATRIDLDDLPPKIAAALCDADEIVLVRNGAVVGRLAAQASAAPETPAPPAPEEDIRQVFDDFRSAVEDEF